MPIRVPGVLSYLLDQDARLRGAVDLSLAEFGPWIAGSRTPFFPGYTDHGPDHLESVAVTAAGLMSDSAIEVATAGDAAVLMLAVLVHDCGMHLTEEGFLALVDSGADHPLVEGFGDRPWPLEWAEYLSRARRLPAERLIEIYGDDIRPRIPPPDPVDWTERDRLLIGEFLRQCHPRLAHEVALWGVPGPDGRRLQLQSVSPELADLIGVIGRSHGLPIRACADHLGTRRRQHVFRGAHPVFLMALLRIADFVQLQAERAPGQLLSVRSLRSPLSRREWGVHASVVDIRPDRADPEALWIEFAPEDVHTFLRAEEWLRGIQSELDQSWAVLGETYALQADLRELGITIRRVRSNLDDPLALAKHVPFVPRHFAFRADPKVLKLLIKPLYGDRPEIGIRELVQNAIDAVRELRALRPRPSRGGAMIDGVEADVLVTLERDESGGWLTVEDRGVGMTVDTVSDYFLTAGASFRQSEQWQKFFLDDNKHSQVLRTGQFGVGALAAFLLGDEIEVRTRHHDSPLNAGVVFRATVESEGIELRRTECGYGTAIRVRLNSETADRLDGSDPFSDGKPEATQAWDWFCLAEPKVCRRAVPGAGVLSQRFELPLPGARLPCTWRRIIHPDYCDIHWTYNAAPGLTCNGIRVVDANHSPSYNEWRAPAAWPQDKPVPRLLMPNVSVFDADAKLSLTLDRMTVARRTFPFWRELLADITRDLIAYLLVHLPTAQTVTRMLEWLADDPYPGLDRSLIGYHRLIPLAVIGDRLTLLDPHCIRELGADALLVIPRHDGVFAVPRLRSESRAALCIADLDLDDYSDMDVEDGPGGNPTANQAAEWCGFWLADRSANNHARFRDNSDPIGALTITGRRVLVRNRWSTKVLERLNQVVSEYSALKGGWGTLYAPGCPLSLLDEDRIPQEETDEGDWPGLVAEVHFEGSPSVPLSAFGSEWFRILGQVAIPLDERQRRTELAHVYEDLHEYIAANEEQKRLREAEAAVRRDARSQGAHLIVSVEDSGEATGAEP